MLSEWRSGIEGVIEDRSEYDALWIDFDDTGNKRPIGVFPSGCFKRLGGDP